MQDISGDIPKSGYPLLSYYRNFLSYKYMTISWMKMIIDIQGWSQAVQQK